MHTHAHYMTANSQTQSKFFIFSYFNIVIDNKLLKNERLCDVKARKNERIITGSPLKGLNEYQDSIKNGITLSSKRSSTVDKEKEI